MPCSLCRKKGIPIDCRYCNNSLCARCIDLTIHNCSGIEDWKKEKISVLEKQLDFKPKKKITLI